MALLVFAGTLFLSAFVLFLVQPMIGKIILPKLGGTPQVWNTCMVFFQTALLAGYAYTHTSSSRLPYKRQLILHGLFLLTPFLVLLPNGPFNFEKFVPPLGGNPVYYTLFSLALLVGLPFIVVATSAPLLQRWFVHTGHPAAKDPYFLYGASNLGSLIALLAYPAIVEPNLTLEQQRYAWMYAYAALAALIGFCAFMVWQSPPLPLSMEAEPTSNLEVPPSPPPALETATALKPGPAPGAARKKFAKGKGAAPAPAAVVKKEEPIRVPSDVMTPWRRLRWVLLAAAPCSLMLGVTTYICTDLSPIPLLWIVPLALYLLTFILVFMRWPVSWLMPIGSGLALFVNLGIYFLAIATILGLFVPPLLALLGIAAAFVVLMVLGKNLQDFSPHQQVLFLQPIVVLVLCLFLILRGFKPVEHSFVALLAFFLTALVCHGELALDRPSTKRLTEYYLWLSVGGMVGGMFNGLVAPILFTGVLEFPIAIVLGCLLRPKQKDSGMTDEMLANNFPNLEPWARDRGNDLAKSFNKPAPNTPFVLHYMLDIGLPLALSLACLVLVYVADKWGWDPRRGRIDQNPLWKFWVVLGLSRETAAAAVEGTFRLLVYGIPLFICFFYYIRPLRLGLGVAGLLMVFIGFENMQDDTVIYAGRSYFGVLRVRKSEDRNGINHSLMHGTTHHGLNYQSPKMRRVATTYYHQFGPAGIVMRQFNWFDDGFRGRDPKDWFDSMLTYKSDTRLTVSLAGLGASTVGAGLALPVEQLVGLWSEPPYATIGLGTGTMASYARPFQHCHFYEIDNKIRLLNLPTDGTDPFFTYLHEARKRGAEVQVRMGDARLRMAFKYQPYNDEAEIKGVGQGGGPDSFYHMMVVDAFSSDAIPIHLITKEAIEMYFKKLTPDGILCVHTSNRHVDLVPVVDAVAKSIKTYSDNGLACKRAHDNAHNYRIWNFPGHPEGFPGHFTSEWVMVARSPEILEKLQPPFDYVARMKKALIDQGFAADRIEARNDLYEYWIKPEDMYKFHKLRYPWTDDYSNVLSVFRW